MAVPQSSYTPTSIVKLIVEILEPYHGRILDPACGSGGMFIQSARFVEAHQKNPAAEISVHGQDQWAWGAHLRRAQRARRVRQRRKLPNQRFTDTARLARLNLAVHGLSGDIKQGNTYYEDLQDSVGRFDFVLAMSSRAADIAHRQVTGAKREPKHDGKNSILPSSRDRSSSHYNLIDSANQTSN